MRVERQQHNFVEFGVEYLGDGFFSERMPIAHGDKNLCIEGRRQCGLEPASLALRQAANRRLAADFGVVVRNHL